MEGAKVSNKPAREEGRGVLVPEIYQLIQFSQLAWAWATTAAKA